MVKRHISLKGRDNVSVIVEVELAQKSPVLAAMIADLDAQPNAGNELCVPRIPGNALKDVFEWVVEHRDDPRMLAANLENNNNNQQQQLQPQRRRRQQQQQQPPRLQRANGHHNLHRRANLEDSIPTDIISAWDYHFLGEEIPRLFHIGRAAGMLQLNMLRNMVIQVLYSMVQYTNIPNIADLINTDAVVPDM